MSIEVYIPAKLETEINKYTDAKGNYNVDYRDAKGSSVYYYLDTPYTPLSKNTVTFKSFPLKVGDNHVSGNIKNYRSLTRDFIFKNTSNSDVCFNITSINSDIFYAMYSDTTYMAITNSFIHSFNMVSVVQQGTVLRPLFLDLDTSALLGYSTTKQVAKLVLKNMEVQTSLDFTNRKIVIQQPVSQSRRKKIPTQYTTVDGITVPSEYVSSSIRNLRCFLSENNSTLKTKLKFITSINNNTANVLNALYSNYTLYSDSLKTSNSDGYSMLLKPQESVLFSEELYTSTDIQSNEIVFGTDKLLYRGFYSALLPTYSQCIKVTLPSTVPIINKEIPSDEDGTIIIQQEATYTVFINDTRFDFTNIRTIEQLFKELRAVLKPLGIITHLLSDSVLVFINTSVADDIDIKTITLFYKNASYTTILNKNELKNIITNTPLLNQNYFLPTNYSLSEDPDLNDSSDIYNDFDYYDCNSFCLSQSVSANNSLANYIEFLVDSTLLKNNSRGTLTIGDNTINLYKDLSSVDKDKVLTVYCDYLNSIQTSAKFTTIDNKIIITNNSSIVSYSLQQSSFSLNNTYQYLVSYLEDRFIFDLKGS